MRAPHGPFGGPCALVGRSASGASYGRCEYTSFVNPPRDDVLVIGGGVIGLATALALIEAGRRVRVLEASVVGSGASHGNCGTLTPSHAPPLAAPGMVVRGLRCMFTPDAPLYLRPRLDPVLCAGWRISPHAATEGRRQSTASRSGDPQRLAQPACRWAIVRTRCEFAEEGLDYVFREQANFDHYARECELLREFGIASETLDGAAYLRDEPALKAGVVGAVRFAGDGRLRPDRYVAELARAVRERGGVIEENCRVESPAGFRGGGGRGHKPWSAPGNEAVIALGSWSPRLARTLGIGLPIQPARVTPSPIRVLQSCPGARCAEDRRFA